MTEEQVVSLMKRSRSEDEWNANADKVTAACGGYPEFWWDAVVLSGVMEQTAKVFGSRGTIEILSNRTA